MKYKHEKTGIMVCGFLGEIVECRKYKACRHCPVHTRAENQGHMSCVDFVLASKENEEEALALLGYHPVEEDQK